MLIRFSLLFLFVFATRFAQAQNYDLMMQAWYWDYFQGGNFGNWMNNLQGKIPDLTAGHFRHVWLPPLSRTSTPNNYSNGYNPKDLYDFGEFGPACAWGTRAQLNALISAFNNNQLKAVSDMIYNHRDGGRPERNPAVRNFIKDMSNSAVYPSDRFLCIVPLGTNNPGQNGPGDYYIKIRPKFSNNNYCGTHQYKLYARTNLTTYNPTVLYENEPNGGGDCNQPSNNLPLGQDMIAGLCDYSGCYIDEFKITLTTANFNQQDDTLFIYMTNYNSPGYSDHDIVGVWSAPRSQDIINEVEYWTYTNFTNLPSGQGAMTYNDFRPNDNTWTYETLGCDWNCPLFFYDIDQSQPSAVSTLNAWTLWQLSNVGIGGLRMDAVKHFDPAFVGQLIKYLYDNGQQPEMIVGEFFDYNPYVLKGWVDAVYNEMIGHPAYDNIRVRAFDFALRAELRNACDQFGYDVRNIFNSGMVNAAGSDQFRVVTFVDNHDIRHEGNHIQNDAMLAYAYILTDNQIGAPCIFYPDYFGGQVGNAPNIMLKNQINQLSQLHVAHIFGSEEIDYLSRINTPYYQYFVPGKGFPHTTLIYQMKPPVPGPHNVIAAINFSGTELDVYQGVNMSWGIGIGATFQDMTGNALTPSVQITSNNEIRVHLPPRSYALYVQQSAAPVELLRFEATAQPASQSVLLEWESALEADFSHYEILRADGKPSDYRVIGRMQPSPGRKYRYEDGSAPLNTPLHYRLRMVDADGSETYSPMRMAQLDADRYFSISPNPAADNAYLHCKLHDAESLLIEIVDGMGRIVSSRRVEAISGEQTISLDTGRLPQGAYYCRIASGSGVVSLPVLKK